MERRAEFIKLNVNGVLVWKYVNDITNSGVFYFLEAIHKSENYFNDNNIIVY